MIYRALLLFSLAPCYHAHAMLPHAHANDSHLIHRTAPTNLISSNSSITHNASPHQKPALRAAVAQHPVIQAIEQGNTEAIIAHFDSLNYWMLPWDYQRQAVTDALVHAAQFPAEKTGEIIAYLLTKVRPEYIGQPDSEDSLAPEAPVDSLLQAAAANKHSAIIQYIEKTFGQDGRDYTAHALNVAIAKGKAKSVQALLDAGVNPHTIRMTRDGSVALYRAFMAFSKDDDQELTAQRIAIVRILLNNVNLGEIPAEFEIDLCHVPKTTRGDVAQLLHNKLVPTRLCMDDQDLSVGSADDDGFDVSFIKPFVMRGISGKLFLTKYANSADPSISPLHGAALTLNYKRCLALLTQSPELIAQYTRYPSDTKDILTRTYQASRSLHDQSPEFGVAAQRLSEFAAVLWPLWDKQLAFAKSQRKVTDPLGFTAQDFAIAAQAPAELIALLDPNNDTPLTQAMPAQIQLLFKAMQIITESKPSGKAYKVGDIITNDGQEFLVIKTKKIQ